MTSILPSVGVNFPMYCNARQMGKSSLRVRTMQRLKADGARCIALDMTRIGSEHLTPLQWYEQIISELWRGANLIGKVNLKSWFADHQEATLAHRLSVFIEEVLLVHIPDQPIVIFVDEIDSTLSLEFPINDFFALIRACYNQRVDNPIYQRLSFCLLRVATPSDLIADKVRTPFNIGKAIALQGFTFNEAQDFAQGLEGAVIDQRLALQIILNLTGGQPFLTQKLCNLACQEHDAGHFPDTLSDQEHIDQVVNTQMVHNWESQDEPAHFRTIRDRLLRNEQQASQLLGHYQRILQQARSTQTAAKGK